MASIEKRITTALLSAIRAHREERSISKSDVTLVSECRQSFRSNFSDFQGVADLKQRWGMAADSLENWDRLWRHNPALAHAPCERPIGWVLEADGQIVGYIGNISLLCRYGDRTLNAVTAHGLVVEPSYRGVGVSLNAAFFRQKAVDFYVCTTTIPAVGKISRALKSDPLPEEDYWTVFFWVLQPSAFAKSMMKKLRIKPFLSRTGGALGSLAIAADGRFHRRRPNSLRKTFR